MKIKKLKDNQFEMTIEKTVVETVEVNKGILEAEKEEIENKHIPNLQARLEEINGILSEIEKAK